MEATPPPFFFYKASMAYKPQSLPDLLPVFTGITSYCSVSDADQYVGIAYPDDIEWSNADSVAKAKALRSAFQRMENEVYIGVPDSDTQYSMWPRRGFQDPYSAKWIQSAYLPRNVVFAQIEQAYYLVKNARTLNVLPNASSSVTAGSVTIDKVRFSAQIRLTSDEYYSNLQGYRQFQLQLWG